MSNNLELGDLTITISTNEDEPVQAKFEMPDGSIVTRPFPNTGELTMKLGLGLGLNVVRASGGPAVGAPANTVLPAVSGDAISGKTLSVSNGTWDDGGAAISGYTYQWKDDGVDISGATINTLLLTDTQIGGVITCTVTATNSAGSTGATSAGTAAVVAALSISGTPVLTATDGEAYDGFTATASGGEAPYTYSLVGTWPAGISINSGSGAVSGTPTESGTFAGLSVRVTDNNSDTADLNTFTLEVEAATGTLNPLDKSPLITLSNGDLTATKTSGGTGWVSVRSTTSRGSGKRYYEWTPDEFGGGISFIGAGFANATASLASYFGASNDSIALITDGSIFKGGGVAATITPPAEGQVVCFAIDLDADLFWCRVGSGIWNANAANNPATGVGGIALPSGLTSGDVFAGLSLQTQATADAGTANFGATAFNQTPPSGFLAWG